MTQCDIIDQLALAGIFTLNFLVEDEVADEHN